MNEHCNCCQKPMDTRRCTFFCEACDTCQTCLDSLSGTPCPCGGHPTIHVPKFNNRKEAELWLETFQTGP